MNKMILFSSDRNSLARRFLGGERVLAQLRSHTSRYKPAYSQQAGETYFMNHCEHCGAKLGDFYMHSELGGAFFPTSPAEASTTVLHKVEAPFESHGSMGYPHIRGSSQLFSKQSQRAAGRDGGQPTSRR